MYLQLQYAVLYLVSVSAFAALAALANNVFMPALTLATVWRLVAWCMRHVATLAIDWLNWKWDLLRFWGCAAALLQFQVQRAACSVLWQLVAALDAVPPNGASVA